MIIRYRYINNDGTSFTNYVVVASSMHQPVGASNAPDTDTDEDDRDNPFGLDEKELEDLLEGLNASFGGGNAGGQATTPGTNAPPVKKWTVTKAMKDLHLPYSNEPEPKNNQKRNSCYWCGEPTKKVPGVSTVMWDVCQNKKCKHFNS